MLPQRQPDGISRLAVGLGFVEATLAWWCGSTKTQKAVCGGLGVPAQL